MAIGRTSLRKSTEEKWRELDPGPKQYNEADLKLFHEKIQKYYFNKTFTDGTVIRKLNFEEMAVAFGAFTRTTGPGGKPYYRASGGPTGETKRYTILNNLWNQYQEWRKKQDWIETKKLETYEAMVS